LLRFTKCIDFKVYEQLFITEKHDWSGGKQ
jgi:hypothetical protein